MSVVKKYVTFVNLSALAILIILSIALVLSKDKRFKSTGKVDPVVEKVPRNRKPRKIPLQTATGLWSEFTPVTYLVSINKLIALGEEEGIRVLIEIAKAPPSRRPYGRRNAINLVLVCRMLFEPEDVEYLRRPKIGRLFFPSMGVEGKDWPHFPIAVEDGVPFLLCSNYTYISGLESGFEYLEYCLKNGKYRKDPTEIPGKEKIGEALLSLLTSERWKKILWEYKSKNSYTFSETDAVKRLVSQYEKVK